VSAMPSGYTQGMPTCWWIGIPLAGFVVAAAAADEPMGSAAVAAALRGQTGRHPRLFLRADGLSALRRAASGTHLRLWERVRSQADERVREGAPVYVEKDRWSGSEQLWQRNVGNTMPLLAMAYIVSGERRYLDAARAWALASCGYPTWGLEEADGMDLAAGHQLLGLAVVYDWCGAGLDAPARETIRSTLLRRGSAMFARASVGRIWWHDAFMQNHLWVNACGLAAAGIALADDSPEAAGWVAFSLDRFRRSVEALGPDGASHEGVGYWEYGVEYLLKFMWLARDLLGVSLYDHPWWRATVNYPLYLSLPRHAWTDDDSIVDIADCPRSHWYGPDYLLRALAKEYRDGHAQWLADEIDQADLDSPGARWLNLLWWDPSLVPVPPGDLPTMRHFDDLGLVSARSSWTGDESLVVFKCGPFIGRHGVEAFTRDPGGGHVHPDANHFVLFGAGDWLVRDDGYAEKWTVQQNTLVVDGRGQAGEGEMWFEGSEALKAGTRPRVLAADSTPALDHVAGDAAPAYPAELGLNRFTRHLLFLKPDVLIVADSVETDRPRALALRFHLEKEGTAAGRVVTARGGHSVLRLESLTPKGAKLTCGYEPIRRGEERHGPGRQFTVRLDANASSWHNAVALSWCAAGSEPPAVALTVRGDAWSFVSNGRTVTLDWRTGAVR